MAYRKIYIAVDCASEEEVQAVQVVAKEASQILRLQARDIIKIAPVAKKNSALIAKTIKTISSEGMKGIAKIIPYFISNFKK
jgi:hypothetical protein